MGFILLGYFTVFLMEEIPGGLHSIGDNLLFFFYGGNTRASFYWEILLFFFY